MLAILLRKCSDDKELEFKRRSNVRGFAPSSPRPLYTLNLKWSRDEGGRGSDIDRAFAEIGEYQRRRVSKKIDRSEDKCTREEQDERGCL
jgi:hypothetical protein